MRDSDGRVPLSTALGIRIARHLYEVVDVLLDEWPHAQPTGRLAALAEQTLDLAGDYVDRSFLMGLWLSLLDDALATLETCSSKFALCAELVEDHDDITELLLSY